MCAVAQPGICGSFEVNPIRVDLAPQKRSAALTVKNNGAESVVVQVASSRGRSKTAGTS